MDLSDDLLELPLSHPLTSISLKQQFLHEFFSASRSIGTDEIANTDNGFQAFFSRFDILLRAAANRHQAVNYCTFADLCWTVKVLNTHESPREDLEKTVAARLDRDIDHSSLESTFLDFTASIRSMMIVGRSVGDVSYDNFADWKSSMFLHPGLHNRQPNLVDTVFPPPSFLDTVKLPQSFTAANLEKVGGIRILWTNNLGDHLLLRDDDTKVMLFHHVSALGLLQYPSRMPMRNLANETIRTIALLIPPTLGAASPWFKQQQQKHRLDSEAGVCDRLNSSERQIDKFHFWRERLVLLKRTYDDAEPKSLSQLWWDDRKKTQWFTFWVAVLVFIMTVFFGVVQSVASIIQAWASVKSLRAPG
ncbi:MAG: hypothetical protein Q9169_005985 [Polycauliona sp. 2 TL-2023]